MNILTFIVFGPVIAAVLCLIVPKRQVRLVAVLGTLATFILSLFLFATFFGGASNSAEVFGSTYGTLHHVPIEAWFSRQIGQP